MINRIFPFKGGLPTTWGRPRLMASENCTALVPLRAAWHGMSASVVIS